MKVLGNLEKRILGDKEPIKTPITSAKLMKPLGLALVTSLAITTGVSELSTLYTNSKILNSLMSHTADAIIHTPIFLGYYLATNKERYTVDGKYSFRHGVYDFASKIITAGGPSTAIIHLVRDPINISLMAITGLPLQYLRQ